MDPEQNKPEPVAGSPEVRDIFGEVMGVAEPHESPKRAGDIPFEQAAHEHEYGITHADH